VRMTGIEPALSAWEACEPTVRWCFQAQRWPFGACLVASLEGFGARGGPEQLIKMATGQLSDAYGTRLHPPRRWRHPETNNALDYRD
jgi:hypothetical protein